MPVFRIVNDLTGENSIRPGRFDLTRTYYLAGPMSGYEDYNYPAFEETVTVLRDVGIDIKSPHEVPLPANSKDMSAKDLWTYMMKEDKKLMEGCSGIILIQGWPRSTGACIELNIAIAAKWPVFYYEDYTLIDMNRSKQ